MRSYDEWLTDGCDVGLDGPQVCLPCLDDDHEECEHNRPGTDSFEQCECEH